MRSATAIKRKRPWAALLGACLLLGATAAQAGVVREDIVVLGSDGRTFTVYKTLRSDMSRRQVVLANGNTVDDYLYIQPDEFKKQVVAAGTRLSFKGGDYAILRTGRLDSARLSAGTGDRFTFHSWNGKILDNGHFGKWNAPNPFETFTYVWIAPERIEVLEYQANRDGEWQHVGNVLVWTGHHVNDLTFRITYRVKSAAPADPLPPISGLATRDVVTDQRITLNGAVLFAPASHKLTKEGLEQLDKLAERIAQTRPERVIITGHTDSQPVAPYLRDTYASNWELSAMRATNVVRKLIERGVNPEILVARALGSQHPITSNKTAAGRASNRRISVVLVGTSKSGGQG